MTPPARFAAPVIALVLALASGCASLPGARRAPTTILAPLQPVAGRPGVLVEPGYPALAARVARLLPRAQARVTATLGQSFRRPVRLRLCGSRRCMVALARNPDRNAESSRDGLLLGPSAFQTGIDLGNLLTHELVHALFRQYLGHRYWRVPAWFHEGVAVLVSGNGAEGVSVADARRALRAGRHFTFYCRRDPAGFRRSFRPGGQLRYRQAAMFVRFIGGTPNRFRRLIAAVLQEGDLCGAYQRIYGQDLRDRWRRFRLGA